MPLPIKLPKTTLNFREEPELKSLGYLLSAFVLIAKSPAPDKESLERRSDIIHGLKILLLGEHCKEVMEKGNKQWFEDLEGKTEADSIKKIKKLVLFHLHPDKNKEQHEAAHEIFSYLSNIFDKLVFFIESNNNRLSLPKSAITDYDKYLTETKLTRLSVYHFIKSVSGFYDATTAANLYDAIVAEFLNTYSTEEEEQLKTSKNFAFVLENYSAVEQLFRAHSADTICDSIYNSKIERHLLLDSNMNCKNEGGFTPFHYLIIHSFCDVEDINTRDLVDFFISQSSTRVNAQNKNGQTVLHMLVIDKKIEILSYLIEKYSNKFDLTIQDHEGNTIGHLLTLGSTLDSLFNNAKHYSVWRTCLDNQAQKNAINMQNNNGETILHVLTRQQHISTKSASIFHQYILAQDKWKWDLNLKDNFGFTVAHNLIRLISSSYESSNDFVTLIKCLHYCLSKMKNINEQNMDGGTILHLLTEMINLTKNASKTAQHSFCQHILSLMQFAWDFNLQDCRGNTIAHHLSTCITLYGFTNSLDTILYKILDDCLSKMNNVNSQTIESRTILHVLFLKINPNDQTLNLLKKYKWNFNLVDKNGDGVIHILAKRGDYAVFSWFKHLPIDIIDWQRKNKEGDAFQHIVVSKASDSVALTMRIFPILFSLDEQKKIDINVPNDKEDTILHLLTKQPRFAPCIIPFLKYEDLFAEFIEKASNATPSTNKPAELPTQPNYSSNERGGLLLSRAAASLQPKNDNRLSCPDHTSSSGYNRASSTSVPLSACSTAEIRNITWIYNVGSSSSSSSPSKTCQNAVIVSLLNNSSSNNRYCVQRVISGKVVNQSEYVTNEDLSGVYNTGDKTYDEIKKHILDQFSRNNSRSFSSLRAT